MLARLRQDYQTVFGRNWPVWLGGIFYGVINVLLFLHFQPWTTLDGVLNWGDNLFGRFGIGNAEALSPLLRSGSIINMGLIAGAFLAALLSGQFGIRIGPVRELIKGAVGGLLMGVGAVLVRGCNIGGFFSGTSAFGLHGVSMAVGLGIGAFLGARYLVWELDHVPAGKNLGGNWLHNPKVQPYVGGVVFLGLIAAALYYLNLGYANRAVILLFGILLGVVSQRTRLCFVRAFREPFLTGESSHTRAMLIALLISIIGFAIVKNVIFEKVDAFVRPTFWVGSLTGGIIFGLGMVAAGGCGGGTMWRVGEGHAKLFLALIGYVTAAAFFNDYLQRTGLIQRLGSPAFLPDMVGGWGWAVLLLLGMLAVWYLIVRWNEETHRLAAI